jgi:endonuclease YncB( thermonuclease family)
MRQLLLLCLLLGLPTALHAEPATVNETAAITGNPDGDTLWLADGGRIRLDGIDTLEIPHQHTDIDRCLPSNRRPDAGGRDHSDATQQRGATERESPPQDIKAECDLTLANAAKEMLRDLAVGKTVRLQINPARRTDRYDRILAQVYVPDSHGGEIWAEEKLLASGLAYVYPLSGREIDTPRMLAIEKTARAAKLGVWQLPEMQPTPAEQAATQYGHYAFIQGKVLATAKIKNKIYLNFGVDWHTDFTVMVERHDWNNFRDVDLLALKGKTIRARGFLHEDNGPMMRANNPGQLEIID